jgi:hypothetical protein
VKTLSVIVVLVAVVGVGAVASYDYASDGKVGLLPSAWTSTPPDAGGSGSCCPECPACGSAPSASAATSACCECDEAPNPEAGIQPPIPAPGK